MAGVMHLSGAARRAAEDAPEGEEEVAAEEAMSPKGGGGINIAPTRTVRIPLWTAKWSRDALLAKWDSLGSRAVAHGFGQFPVSEEDLLFKPKWVDDACDNTFILPDYIDATSPFYKMRRFAGCDIAVGTIEAEAAYWVLLTIAIDMKTHHRYVIGMERHRGLTIGRQYQLVAEGYDTLRWEVCGVESNGIQVAFENYYREQGRGRIAVKGIHTGKIQKNDEEVGLPSLGAEWEHGKWHIPWGNERSRRIMEPFVQELKAYPTGRFTDTVMAHYFAREMYVQGPQARVMVVGITY